MDKTYAETNLNETLQRFNFKLSKILTHSLKKEIEYTKESLSLLTRKFFLGKQFE